MADWAKGEREKLRADKKAQKATRAAVGYQAGRRAAERTEGKSKRARTKNIMRKLGSVMKKGKGGVSSYKDFMGG
jgi:hypothetical protein